MKRLLNHLKLFTDSKCPFSYMESSHLYMYFSCVYVYEYCLFSSLSYLSISLSILYLGRPFLIILPETTLIHSPSHYWILLSSWHEYLFRFLIYLFASLCIISTMITGVFSAVLAPRTAPNSLSENSC